MTDSRDQSFSGSGCMTDSRDQSFSGSGCMTDSRDQNWFSYQYSIPASSYPADRYSRDVRRDDTSYQTYSTSSQYCSAPPPSTSAQGALPHTHYQNQPVSYSYIARAPASTLSIDSRQSSSYMPQSQSDSTHASQYQSYPQYTANDSTRYSSYSETMPCLQGVRNTDTHSRLDSQLPPQSTQSSHPQSSYISPSSDSSVQSYSGPAMNTHY